MMRILLNPYIAFSWVPPLHCLWLSYLDYSRSFDIAVRSVSSEINSNSFVFAWCEFCRIFSYSSRIVNCPNMKNIRFPTDSQKYDANMGWLLWLISGNVIILFSLPFLAERILSLFSSPWYSGQLWKIHWNQSWCRFKKHTRSVIWYHWSGVFFETWHNKKQYCSR